MDKKTRFYTEQTLKSWDQAAEIHQHRNQNLPERVSSSDFNVLEPDFSRLLAMENLAGASVVQICCNNGKDLLSIKNKGAGYCLGIDGSKKFIDQAKALAQSGGYRDVEFEAHNVYAIPEKHFGSYDFVVVTVGVVNWMPDLPEFFRICSQLLKPGGGLLMEELHPVLNMYAEGRPSYIAHSYFDRAPQIDTDGLDYFSGEKYEAEENFYFHHTLSDILMAAITNNLQLQMIEELSSNIGNICGDLEKTAHNPPLAFIASWKRE